MSTMVPIKNCKFKYKCPKDWFELDSTDDTNIRFCQKCSQNVYLCQNEKELQKAIETDRCIAIFYDGTGSSMTLGMPESPSKYKTDR